jgi:hypothetical protein
MQRLPTLKAKPQAPELVAILPSFLKPQPSDWPFIVLCLAISLYLLFSQPFVVALMLCAGLVHLSLTVIAKAIPQLQCLISSKIRIWHVATVIGAIVLLLNTFDAPAQALFLNSLETFITQIAQQSGNSVSAAAIKLIFNILRGVFVLAVIVLALFAYSQAMQGNDWRPIGGTIAIAFGIVLAIDVLTYLFTK